jgi:hypothetical protein
MRIKTITVLFLIIVSLLSCDDKLPQELIVTSYPMSIGTSWTYEKTWTINSYYSVTSDSITSSYTTKIIGILDIYKDTIIDNKKLLVFRTRESVNNDTTTTFQYNYMDNDGLKCFAYKDVEFVFPNNITVGSNDVFIYKTPILNIKFPLTTNTVWVSNSSVNEDLPITKKVIGTDTLLIDNQEYPCLKISYDYPAANTNGSTIQWISKVGLLKEETNSNSALIEPHKMSSIIKMTVLSMRIK